MGLLGWRLFLLGLFGWFDKILSPYMAVSALVAHVCVRIGIWVRAHDIVRSSVALAPSADNCGRKADEQTAKSLPGGEHLANVPQKGFVFLG